MKSSKINRLVIALTGVLVLSIGSAYAGSAYSDGRAYLRQGSPSGAGKVYVSTSSATPAASSYKACNTIQTSETTTPSASAQVKGEKTKTTYHFWAVANAGYIFTGWYDSNGNLLGSGAAHVSGSVTSGQAGGSDTHAYLDYHASFIKQIQMSFITPTNGSYTITHCDTEVTPAYSSFATEGKVVLSAMPADGYKLRGWYTTTNGGTTKKYFAFGTTCEPNFTSNVTIGADFVPDDGKATFWNKNLNKIYNDLNTANSEAASGNIIVAVSDGVLGAGTYTIKAGVTLLIPFDETYNLMTTPKVNHMASGTTSLFLFRKLTLAPGAVINCSGNICVGGQMASVNGGRASSYPMGACGMLDLSRGGTVNLESGSVLYAWGFVKGQDMEQGNNTEASGVGKIVAKSGATVWEDFQVGEWRGGTASQTIYNNKSSWKFFPFQSYTIQNVEAPVEYQTGSKLKCYWAIFGNGQTFTVPFTAVGASADKPLFVLGTGGTMKKWYDPTTDRVCYELGGGASIDAISLSVMGESVSSSDYYLPIPANMHIALSSGCTLNLTKAMTMHAGSVVEVKSGATLNINARVHMFDQEDWGTYCMYAYYYRTYRNLTSHYNRGEGTSKATLEDATLIVDGTVNVGNQMLYATAHGANICGNGGGTLKYGTLAGNQTMTQCTTLSDANSVNIRSANLHNDNDSYTKGIASTTFKNVNGRWFTNANSTWKSDKTFNFTYIKSGDVYGTAGTNGTVKSCYSKDKTGLVLQDKWANVKAQGCSGWFVGLDDDHLYNYTRNTAWHQYIKTGSTTTGSGEEAVTTDTYVGSDGKMLYKTDCEFVEAGTIDGNCLYPSDKALVNGSLITVAPNASPDHGYHKSDAATTYYLCFEGCVWHPATQNAENRYTVDGKVYIWYGDKWLGVEYDSGVSLYYSLSATNVKIYYEYVNHEWVPATPVAEVTTSAGTEQVYSLATAVSKAAAGGTNVTIRLLKNLSGTISYTGANNCGLDLNGFTLSSSTSGMITVNSATATFIIKDQSAAGTGKVQLSYSANARRYAISVTKGHLVVNSGTISAINTSAYASGNTSVDVGAITVANGHKVTVNGGSIEAISDHNPYGIYLAGATARATINGGTIEAKTTERSSSVDSPYGIIGAGSIYVNGGTVKATCYRSSSSRGISSSGTFTMTGGSVIATASSTCYGVYAASGSNTTISGGTVTSTTTGGTARALISYATATVSGGTLTATAGGSDAKGIYVAGGTTTVNTGATVSASATTNAYGIYYADGTPTVTVNGGAFTVSTTSTTGAYGVYAAKGTGTINDGTFTVTAKTTGAEGMHVETTNTPKLTLNGGKFMVKNSDGAANGTINNTGATLANFSMAGGYFNVAPNGTTNIAAGKSVQDVVRAKEQAIYDAGYVKKIRGNEYTVTWKNYNGTTLLGTTQVESGKVPVWTGTPEYYSTTATLEFDGWSTEKKNGGTTYLNGAALPAIVDADVTYYAHYKTIYAEVIAGGSTTRYSGSANTAIQNAWNAAKAYTNATLRILSNYGTEAAGGKCLQLVFNPTNANSTLTFDLNGHSWVHGNHGTASNNKDIFLHVNPAQANCKLIITDNSASGNGYLMNMQARTDGVLLCAKVSTGELILQGGGLRVNNTADAENMKYSVGVQVNGSTQFTMTGGKVYATDEYSPRGINVSPSGNADIVGGTVHADATGGNAYGVLAYGTVAVGGDALVKATTAGSGAYPGYVDGGTLTVADSCSIVATAPSNARDLYVFNAGKITVNDKPTITATVTSGSEAYGCYVSGSGSEIEVNGGTYELIGAAASGSVMGVRAISSGVATINNGTFTLQGGNNWTFGVFAQTGTVNINGGDFTVSQASGGNKEGIRVYPGGTCNITGGTFTVTTIGSSGGNALHAYGGTTNISGNPIFNAYYGVTVADGVVANGATTATVVIDGGTYNTQSFGVNGKTTSRDDEYYTGTNTGDVTVWDGKFKSAAGWNVLDNSSPSSCLKIRGGWYSNNSSGKLATGSGNFVVSPSTVEALTSGPEYDAGYRYHVISKYNVTWSINGVNTVQEYSRNETPSYGSTPTIDDGNTWEFLGWSPELAPVTADVTYTAQFRKYEAEVYEGENPTPKRFEHFTDAWSAAKNLPVAKVKLLSNVSMSTQLVLTPDSAAGSKPLTLDLNNHTLAYTGTTDRFVIVNKAGCVLKVADSSVANGGVLKYEGSYNGGIYTVVSYSGDIVLESGKIFAKNTYAGKSSRAVTPCGTTTFTMTGGTAEAHAATDARAIAQDGTPSINVSGGKVIAKSYTISGDTVWGSTSYGICMGHGSLSVSGNPIITSDASASALGVYMYNSDASFEIDGGTFTSKAHNGSASYCIYTNTNSVGNIIRGGTFKAIGLNGGQIHAVHAIGSSKIDISGGTFTSHANAGQSHCLFVQSGGTLNISGGSFTAESDAPSNGNIEAVRMWTGGVVNISGGTFTSTGASNNIALRNLGGTATISGGTFTSGNYTIGVAEAGSIGSVGDVRVNINGGTFISTTNRNIYASTNEGTTSVAVTVNGGYLHSAGTNVVEKAGTATIVLNGGKYNETSGSNHKTNITSYKGSTTTVSDISETVAGKTYVYELLTKFNISWRGGSSYTKDEQIYSGIVPTNNELVGKYFLRNDSAFYFTGWSPTPTAVAGDATYQALGEYHVAKVTVAAKDSIFDDFDEAWNYAMTQTNATITLLNNLTRTESIIYIPENANARHTFDLNNFTIKENTKDRLLVVNKSDAKLTITDNSSEKGGCLYKKMNSSANMYTTVIYHGELILAGGKLYVENTKDDKEWHPALAVHTSVSTDGIFTMTGGTVESQAKYLAYPIYNYATTNISGGTVIANATSGGNALGFYAVAGTATISGGTFNVTASTNAIGAIATGWISADGSNNQQGTLNITGGTFNVSCTTSGAHAVQATGTGKNIGGTYYTSHGIMNVSGGTFNVTCPPVAEATQVFAAVVNAWRQFDNALPHSMVAEAKGEMNISGGTFTVDARDDGAWVANKGNVDLLRNWGTLNVSGGNFTIHQYSTPSAISVFRGKATVTGNPVFNVYAHTGNAYAVCAGYWTHENYCDKNAANNLAEAEVNGGTYNIITEGQNTNVIYSLGQISVESRDAVADTITAHAGYAMNAKVTVNGGTFLGICPNESGHYPIMLNSRTDQVGTYGTAKSEIYVNGGKFKSRKGTSYETSTTTGAVNCHNVVGTLLLTGGYYETNGQLNAQKADTCIVTNITSADIDPEYNNGYRYRIDVDYQAKVTVGVSERKFALFRDAFDYAKTQNNATITLLRNINYEGLNFMYNPSSVRSCTLDLNGFTFKGAVSGHTGDASYNNDRLLVINKAGATFTIKDSSVGKTGKWSHEKAGAGFSVIVYRGLFVLESGTVHGKNTSGGSVQALRSENYPEALISVTGGKAHAETAGTAYGMSTYNKATISGGEILAESSAGEAFGVYTNAAEDTTVISGGRIYAAGTNGYGVRSASITTISGGKIIGECINTTGVAYGVSVAASTTTITGVDSIYAHATKNAYGVYSAGTGVATINGGKIVARNSDKNGATISAYAINSGTININNGTFYIYRDVAGSSNIQTTRTGNNATMNITGGTFHAEGYQAVNARGGTTNISGGTFYGTTGICAMDWADAATITANVNVTGGTFTTTGTTIYVSSNNANNGGRNGHSVVWINGGKFKSTGSTIVSMNATPSGADPSTLTIAGGYFNEKSGTTFKDQIATYVADTSEINTLDPLYEGIYKYEVAPHYVAKVQTGSTTKYHTTAKAAFDYAKTVANPTITLLDNCTLSPDGDATNYNRLNSNSWTGTLDLNNFILTPTISSEGRAFTVSGTGSKLTITDNSGAKGGKIYYQGPSTASLIYFVVEGSAEVELAAGTLYVEDTSADKVAVGFVVNSSTAKFTQSGGTFTVKGKYQAQGYYGSGTATFSGGSMYVEGETSQAIGLHPNAATAVLNVSGTFELDAKSTNNAYAVYAENGTATIEGTPDFYAESPTRARVLQGTSSGNLTVDGGTFEANGTTASQSDCYVLIPEGTSTITVNGGKFKNNQNNFTYKASGATLTINGGYFNETSGTNHKTKIDPYKGSGKVVLNLDTDDAEYAAGYRYIVTDDPVAKVQEGSTVTYYTSVADAITAANGKTNPTVTMLKDASVPAEQTITTAMTIDLNGKTVSSTQAASTGVFKINASGKTVTINGTGGTIKHTANASVYGINVAAGTTLNMTGGTVIADGGSGNPRGIYVRGASGSIATVSLTDVTVESKSTGNNSIAVYTHSYTDVTIHSGTYTATATSTSARYAAYARSAAGSKITIEGGKFNGEDKDVFRGGTTATISISGGYYVHDTNIETYCATNHHVLPASLTEGGITYNYKVAEAYTLTWNLDGGEITAEGTPAGYVEVGATLTAPTVTKTGYTFAAWTPAVAATMPAANTTYTATWTEKSYTVTFYNGSHGTVKVAGSTIANGGTASVNHFTTKTLAATASTGYTFAGWTKTGSVTIGNTANASTNIKATAAGGTVTATWTANSYTITYKDQGNVAFSGVHGDGYPTSHTYGTATALVSPTKEGYTFGGWYTTSACTGDAVTSLGATAFTADITLYAKWTINNYTLTVVASPAGYGTVSGGGTYTYNTSHTITATANTGYHFVQWNDANTSTSRSVTIPASNVTYTATFAVNTNTAYTVKHYKQNVAGDGYDLADTDNLTGTTGASVTPAVKSYEGFTAPSTQTVTVLADGSRVVTYNYTRNSYTLTWALDGGSISVAGTPAGFVKYGASLTAPTVTKTGYTFAGWSPEVPSTMPAANTEYTATWTVNSYTIRFLNYDGSVLQSGSVNYGETPVYSGETPSKPADATYTYTFTGWSPAIAAVSGAQDYTAQYSTTDNVASVTVGGATSYYTTITDAWGFVNEQSSDMTITILKDITDISSSLVYTPAAAVKCTLNLNNHLVKGAVSTALLDVNMPGSTFVITDESVEKGGELYNEPSGEALYYGAYLTAGTLKLLAGKVHAKNTKDDYASLDANAKKCRAYGIYVAASQTFQMSGGEIEGEAIYVGYGLVNAGSATISGGTIHGKTSKYTTATGVYSTGTTNISGGTIKATAYTTTARGLYVAGGTTNINSGDSVIIESKTTTSTTAYGIYHTSGTFNAKLNCKLRVSVEAKTNTAYGIFAQRTVNINGGKFYVTAKGNTAYGILTQRGITTIQGNPEFTVKATTKAYGVAANGTTPSATTLGYSGTIKVKGGTFNVETTSSTIAYGAYAYAGSGFSQTTTGSSTPKGNYINAGTIEISGGEFNVKAKTYTAYGIYVANGTKENADAGEPATAYGKCTVSGNTAKFKVTSTSDATKAYAMNTIATNTDLVVEGGYYNINTNLSGYVAPTKSCNYYCLETTAADKAAVGSDYNYKVAVAYTLTWNLNGGTVTTAGTGAAVDATGTPSIVWGVGDAISAPVVTKTGYTFTAWTPAVAAKMPAANTTYTATWTAAESGSYADIVDVDNANSKLIVNVTSWPVNGWPYSINGVPYAKDAREDDRTLKVTYSGAPGDDFPMLIQKTNGDVYSHHTYVIPQEVKSATTLSANETKNLFVKNGANLTVNANIAVKNIYVAPGSKLTINSGKTLTADTIFLRTTAEGAAEMVKNGSIAGTTKLVYTRIIKDKDFHLFGLPLPCPISSVRLSDGLSPAYGTGWLLRSYNEARRANMGADDNNWVSLAAGSTIAGGAGYELYSASNYYREFYFPVSLPTTNKVAVAYTSDGAAGEKQAGWNALVSPFTHTYTNDPAPEDLVVNWYMDGYGYYEQEIPSVIPPAKPFAFQTSEAGYLSFEGSAIAITKMPRRASEEEVQIQWIHLDITDADGIGDQTSVYSHPTRYEAAYQTGIDVAKQSLTAARAILYSSHAYGEMAFAGVADSLLEQGVALTVFSPKPQELTISLRNNRWLDRLAEVWLVDTETGAQIDLFDSDYTFETNEGTTRGRLFLMGRFKAPNIATDIDNTEATEGTGVKAQKLIIRDKMYIRINGQLYDATGKQVNVK